MGSKINEIITGKYDHMGDSVIYGDTDSIEKSSIIETSIGKKTIEDLFLNGSMFWKEGDKEYSNNSKIQLLEYDSTNKNIDYKDYNYVYRHKVTKKKYKIFTTNGKSIIVTEDHSLVIIDSDGNLVSKTPKEITKGDKIISI